MWDLLVEHLAVTSGDEDARVVLMDAVQSAAVTQEILDRLTPLVTRSLALPCALRLIPYGRDAREQTAILSAIAQAAPRGRVVIDVTHGFRHLAAVGLTAAFFLERTVKLDVAGVYYGALEMTQDGVTPVLRLDGLAATQEWIDALDHFDANGDYGVFAPLLIRDGVAEDKARCLGEAAFYERTFNLLDARRKLQTFLPELERELSGASELFRRRLLERLDWAHGAGLAEHQRRLAYLYLGRQDFVRAAVFGWESLITRECDARGFDAADFAAGRSPAIEALEFEISEGEHPDWKREAYWNLKNLRNALAHGNPPRALKYQRMMHDAGKLGGALDASFKRLLG
jgi:CRISPR-associated Csx2 family protein